MITKEVAKPLPRMLARDLMSRDRGNSGDTSSARRLNLPTARSAAGRLWTTRDDSSACSPPPTSSTGPRRGHGPSRSRHRARRLTTPTGRWPTALRAKRRCPKAWSTNTTPAPGDGRSRLPPSPSCGARRSTHTSTGSSWWTRGGGRSDPSAAPTCWLGRGLPAYNKGMKTPVRPRYLPPPYQDSAESGRLILRDGTTAQIRLARPEDRDALRTFSGAYRPSRAGGGSSPRRLPRPDLIATLCDSSDPRARPDPGGDPLRRRAKRTSSPPAPTWRKASGRPRSPSPWTTLFQGKGLGTLLLERLACWRCATASRASGPSPTPTTGPCATSSASPGFAVEETPEGGDIEVDLSVRAAAKRAWPGWRCATAWRRRPRCGRSSSPEAVAVVGASRDPGQHRLPHPGSAGPEPLPGAGLPGQPEGRRRSAASGPTRRCATCRSRWTWRSSPCRGTPCWAWSTTAPPAACGRWWSSPPASPRSAPKGASCSDKLVDKVRGHGMRMIGPNCMGLLNTDPAVRLNASFSPGVPAAGPGGHVVAERRPGPGDPGGRAAASTWACPPSSASATRPTSPATTCCNTGKRTRTPT